MSKLHYQILRELQAKLKADDMMAGGGNCRIKVGVNVEKYIWPSSLVEHAVKCAETLEEIHRLVSAGCPLGDDPHEFIESLNDIIAQREVTK